MDHKLVILLFTKVYMTDSHCNKLSKQEVSGFRSKRIFGDDISIYILVYISTFCLFKETDPEEKTKGREKG